MIKAKMEWTLMMLSMLLGCASAPIETVSPSELESRLSRMVPNEAPGIVVGAVYRDGRRVYRAAGRSDQRHDGSVSVSTPFAFFSVTKLFTATAVLKLVEQGRLELDLPVHHYLPNVRLEKNGRAATVRHLLAHASGLPNPIPVTWIHLADEPAPSLDAVTTQHVGMAPKLDFEPGSRSAYSNLGYLLLGQIVEKVTGERFEDFMAREVLAPLGARATRFGASSERASGHQYRWSPMGLVARFMLDERFFEAKAGAHWVLRPFDVDGAPYGGLSGPIDDLLCLGEMMLNEGRGRNGSVLSPESVRLATNTFVDAEGQATKMGLGWHLGKNGDEPYAYHIGGGGGFRVELRIYPRLGYAVAVMANETSFPTGDLSRLVIESPTGETPLARQKG